MAANDPSPRIVVVCDAGPLIHLDELRCVGLLSDFSRVLLPNSVWREVSRHRPTALSALGPKLEQSAPASQMPADLISLGRLFALHSAELDALRLAREVGADLFLTDDTAARLASRQLLMPVHGTIGILLRAIRRGQKSKEEVSKLLRSLPEASSLHIRNSLLEEIVAEVERYP